MIDEKDISKQQNTSEPKDQSNPDSIKEDNNNEKLSENENKLEENSNGNNGRWGKKEHLRFLAGCLLYKNNWKKVETYVRTRTSTQIRSHAQKYLKKLEKKYFSKSPRNGKSPNDSFNDELNDLVFNKKENEDNNNTIINNNEINKEEEKKNENENNKKNELINDEIKEEKFTSLKLDELDGIDNKSKLSEEKIKQLVEDLNKEDFNVEIVEKYIIYIFRPNKKCEDLSKPEIKKSASKSNNNTHVKTSKNIFLCQKQKREINYESKVKDLLNSNSPNDLEQLLKIYNDNNTQEHDILLYLLDLENN
jgi:SHAQKYF class myb-like DNA-binding protein